jgi:hypothetical protein
LLTFCFLFLWVCIAHPSVTLSIYIRKRNTIQQRGYTLDEIDRLEPVLFK